MGSAFPNLTIVADVSYDHGTGVGKKINVAWKGAKAHCMIVPQ